MQIVAECWEPVGFMKCFTAEFQRGAMAKVIADTSGRYFKSGVDPIAAREHEEEPAPAVTRAAVAAGGGAELGGQRALKAGGCLRAKLEGKLVYYLRLDKQAKRSGLWSVGVCNKSREQSGGEKPRATTVLKMTHDEIRAAVSAAAADEPACKFFLKAKPRKRRKKHGAHSETQSRKKKTRRKKHGSPLY